MPSVLYRWSTTVVCYARCTVHPYVILYLFLLQVHHVCWIAFCLTWSKRSIMGIQESLLSRCLGLCTCVTSHAITWVQRLRLTGEYHCQYVYQINQSINVYYFLFRHVLMDLVIAHPDLIYHVTDLLNTIKLRCPIRLPTLPLHMLHLTFCFLV